MADEILQIFAKAPISGQVKTRLIPALGAAGATALARQLIIYTLQQFTPHFTVQLWCSPDTQHPFFQHCQQQFPQLALHTQKGADLGARMTHALGSTPAATVLIGSDCPSLNTADIQQAFTHLATDIAVVLAPAEDGGYVLIGMRQVVTNLFTDIPWSTPQVLTITRQRLQALNLSYQELPLRWDVDHFEDVQRFQAL